jgi:hypothetical protein
MRDCREKLKCVLYTVSVYVRHLDPSVLPFSVFHYTDTHLYVFSVGLALPVVHNKISCFIKMCIKSLELIDVIRVTEHIILESI